MAFYDNGGLRPAGFAKGSGGGRWPMAGLFFAAGALLALSELEPAAVVPLRLTLAGYLAPVATMATDGATGLAGGIGAGWAALTPPWKATGMVAGEARIAALQLRVADLERENRDLKALARYSSAGKTETVPARVVMSSGSPLAQTILIDAGSNQGVRPGYPVVTGDGLAGRVVAVFADQASVMLLGDRMSRVPVLVGAGQARAVLVGTGDGAGRLEFVGAGAQLAPGDLVTTSGAGGVFPRGLAIGVVGAGGVGGVGASGSNVELTAGRDDPLVVGVLLLDGGGYESIEQVTAKSERMLGQVSGGRGPEVAR